MNDRGNGSQLRHEVALLPSRKIAEEVIHALIADGFAPGDISLFVQAPVDETAESLRDGRIDEAIEVGGEKGAGLGAVAGGLGGVLAGFGLLAIPGIGPTLAVGPLAAALTGTISGSALGGLAGSLVGLGISEVQAKAAEQHLKAGRAILIVQCGDRREEALAVLRAKGHCV
ncbi:hypothetical protein [Sphingomonas sp. dw_22]|uniref:hypothetical protein n=1 Tax=Sphingomonas sp. dw_22 TaxID=2721175 RepID=UPI001BD3A361|nr:hypothetical protein [Sphingomonas sp. dw_22]